ncbi:hypothetical protein, partial [Sulfitobacter sp.]|uniref:hypothetical protein n=1 Tax=Sulfitobacter sp. TaxID=1903071 RepID=UPI003296CECD
VIVFSNFYGVTGCSPGQLHRPRPQRSPREGIDPCLLKNIELSTDAGMNLETAVHFAFSSDLRI